MNIQQKVAIKKNCSRAATITHTFWKEETAQLSVAAVK